MSTVLVEPQYHMELIDGREIQKPLPKNRHAFIQSYLVQWFGRELPKRFRSASELNVLCGPDRLVPDVTVMARNARYDDGDLADPAVLAVEILSPGQTVANLFDKAGRLVKAGTPVCWVIWPERRKSWEYSASDLVEAKDFLTAPLPEANEPLAVPLAEMWAELD